MRTIFPTILTLALTIAGRTCAADGPTGLPPAPAAPAAPAGPPMSMSSVAMPESSAHYDSGWAVAPPEDNDTDTCSPPGDFWLHYEYILWFLKGSPLPPLATAGPTGSGGVLGQPGVTTTFGGATEDHNPYSGGRFWGGIWLNTGYTLGVEGGYFFVADRSVSSLTGSAGQPGAPDLGRPFFNVVTGLPSALVVASAGVDSGYVTARADTELQGGEVLLAWNLARDPHYNVTLLGGIRYVELGDVVNVTSASQLALLPGIATTSQDQFVVRNHFYGGELGVRAAFAWRSLMVTVTEKLAVGGNAPDITIAGGTFQTSAAGVGASVVGGVLAQPSNIGNHSYDTFCLVDETGVQVGWQLNEFLQAFVGYSLLYESSVVRAGNVIDFGVNPNQGAGGPVRPLFAPHATDFIAHGISVGMELRF